MKIEKWRNNIDESSGERGRLQLKRMCCPTEEEADEVGVRKKEKWKRRKTLKFVQQMNAEIAESKM